MATLKLIGITGIRIEPDGAGYRVLGEFRPTLPGAIRFAQGYEIPEEDDVNDSRSAADYDDPQGVYEDMQLARERKADRWLNKMYPI